jgi:hypothetical protein
MQQSLGRPSQKVHGKRGKREHAVLPLATPRLTDWSIRVMSLMLLHIGDTRNIGEATLRQAADESGVARGKTAKLARLGGFDLGLNFFRGASN